jgi:hypothetical protein
MENKNKQIEKEERYSVNSMQIAREKIAEFMTKVDNLKTNLPFGLKVIHIYEEPFIKIKSSKTGFFMWKDFVETEGKLSFLAFNPLNRKGKQVIFSDLNILFNSQETLKKQLFYELKELEVKQEAMQSEARHSSQA